MITYISLFLQTGLDAIALFIITRSLVFKQTKWMRQSLVWSFVMFLFMVLFQVDVDVSGKGIYLEEANLEYYQLLPVHSWLFFIMVFTVALILNSALFQTGTMETIYATVLSFLLWISLRLVSVLIVYLFIENALIERIVTLLFVLLILLLPRKKLVLGMQSRSVMMKLVLFSTFILVVAMLMMADFSQAVIVHYGWLVLLTILLVVGLNVWMLYEQRKKIVEEQRITIIEQYMPVIDDLVAEMRMKQHEFDNRLLAIISIVETEHDVAVIRERMQHYVAHITPKYAIEQVLQVSHKVMAGFLYSKMKLAEWKNIKLTMDIQTDFQNFCSNEYDWITALGILVDNAMEATLPGEEIKVSLKNEQQWLEISVTNTHSYMTNDQFMELFVPGYSSKNSQAKSRGYGLFALKQLVDQYNGKVLTKNETNTKPNCITIGVWLP
ncbi:sensor histidine kinase [Paenibacillus yanchengensis]|uniref:Sensor histidine kinase n=1 Tax=Paenibacillus yanchengensis TaxID=2035833 RepID=A0ABW4YF24_9BACL